MSVAPKKTRAKKVTSSDSVAEPHPPVDPPANTYGAEKKLTRKKKVTIETPEEKKTMVKLVQTKPTKQRFPMIRLRYYEGPLTVTDEEASVMLKNIKTR